MGFLNKKQRIIDTYMTPYGRKKLAEDGVSIKYIAATDSSAMYPATQNKDLDEEFTGLLLEARTSYQDQIFFTTNVKGKTIGKNSQEIAYLTDNYTITTDGRVYDTDSTIVGGSDFVSLVEGISTGSFERLRNKGYLKTKQDPDYKKFQLDKKSVTFYVQNNSPIKSEKIKEINVDVAEPFFFDKFISSTDSYRFLPPVMPLGEGSIENVQLGEYTDLNQKDIVDYQDISNMIKDSPYHDVLFEETSANSNIVFQMFGINDTSSNKTISKLETIDFGEYGTDEGFKKVVFAGKVFVDNYNYPTYINIFTIVLEE